MPKRPNPNIGPNMGQCPGLTFRAGRSRSLIRHFDRSPGPVRGGAEKSFTRRAGTGAPLSKDFSTPRLRRSGRNDGEGKGSVRRHKSNRDAAGSPASILARPLNNRFRRLVRKHSRLAGFPDLDRPFHLLKKICRAGLPRRCGAPGKALPCATFGENGDPECHAGYDAKNSYEGPNSSFYPCPALHSPFPENRPEKQRVSRFS